MENRASLYSKYPFLGTSADYTGLPLTSSERPIKVLETVKPSIPKSARLAAKFLNPEIDRVRFKNGNEGFHWRITALHGVMLAHVDDNSSVALVRNYRHPLGHYSVELPSGGVDETVESLLSVLSNDEAEALVQRAKSDERSIIDYLTPEQKERVLKAAATRETREETGIDVDSDTLQRLIPDALRGSVGFAGNTYNIFYGGGGTMTSIDHDDGEMGMLTSNRVSIEDAGEMIGHEIVDPATATAISALTLMYGFKPSWLPTLHR